MAQFVGVLPFLLVLGIKDNNNLAGRRILFFNFVIVYLVGVATMKYLVVTDESVWGTTVTKLLCENSTDSDCVPKTEKILLADILFNVVVTIYFASVLYRY